MAVSSPLNPSSITGSSPAPTKKAQSFISGGEPLGSSVVGAGGIGGEVGGFKRAAVRPVTPNIGSIIQSISSNILNTVDNSIQNVTNLINNQVDSKVGKISAETQGQITQIRQQQGDQVTKIQQTTSNLTQRFQQNINNLTGQYQKKINDLDSSSPNRILDKFLKTYQNALEFVQFFGNKKNIKGLRDNLQTLRLSFTESFEVAKLVRKTIFNIVKQLSNLPKVRPGAPGGLNLNVRVPNQKLGGPKPRIPRGGPAKLLLGALGLTALGTGASALVNNQKTTNATGSDNTGPLQDAINWVGDTVKSLWDKILDILYGIPLIKEFLPKRQKKEDKPVTATPAPTPAPEPDPGSVPIPSTAKSPSTGPVSKSQRVENAMQQLSGLPQNFQKIARDVIERDDIDLTSQKDRAAVAAMLGVGRMESNFNYPDAYSGRGGTNNAMRGFLQINEGVHPNVFDSEETYLDYSVPKFKGKTPSFTGKNYFDPKAFAGYMKDAQTGWDFAQAVTKSGFSSKDFDPLDTPQESNRLSRENVKVLTNFVHNYRTLVQGSGGLGIDPSMIALNSRTALGQNIAQPVRQVGDQSTGSTAVIPMNLGGGQQGSGGGGGTIQRSQPNQGPTIPFLATSHDENFLTMYSRIQYNIVDG